MPKDLCGKNILWGKNMVWILIVEEVKSLKAYEMS